MLPYDSINPYQSILSQGLEQHGISVSCSPWRWRLPVGAPLRPNVLHIHWLHYWTQHSSSAKLAISIPFLKHQLNLFRSHGGILVWTVHNLHSHEGANVGWERYLGRMLGRLADAVIVHNQTAVEPVLTAFEVSRSKVSVIPHPSYPRVSNSQLSRQEARSLFGLPRDGLVFAALGSLRPYKGLEELLDAHQSTSDPRWHLVIAGSPILHEYGDFLLRRARECPSVDVILRQLRDEELERLMDAADAIVLPYRAALTSGMLVQAMGAGKACIAPRFGVFQELLGDQGGFLYEPSERDGLRSALLKAAQYAANMVSMGQRNQRVASNWTASVVGELTAGVALNVIRARRLEL